MGTLLPVSLSLVGTLVTASLCGDYGMASSLSCFCGLALVSVLSCWVTESLGVELKGCPYLTTWEVALVGAGCLHLPPGKMYMITLPHIGQYRAGGYFSKYRRFVSGF